MYFSHLQHFVDQSHGCMPVTLDLILQLHYTETQALRVNGTFTNISIEFLTYEMVSFCKKKNLI